MKKLINLPENVVTEALHGMAAAHGDLIKVSFDPAFITRAAIRVWWCAHESTP